MSRAELTPQNVANVLRTVARGVEAGDPKMAIAACGASPHDLMVAAETMEAVWKASLLGSDVLAFMPLLCQAIARVR